MCKTVRFSDKIEIFYVEKYLQDSSKNSFDKKYFVKFFIF